MILFSCTISLIFLIRNFNSFCSSFYYCNWPKNSHHHTYSRLHDNEEWPIFPTTTLITGTTLIKNGSSFPPPRLFRVPRLLGREEYFKNGIEKSCERVPRIDKKMEVKEVAKTLIEQGGSYLRRRSHVANIKNTLPLIRESFNGKYIEMDFSENIAMKPKFEVQDAHFSGKQYSALFNC